MTMAKKERRFMDLPEKQRAFANFVVQGLSYADAYLKAGYMQGRSPRMENVRRQAMRNGAKLACDPTIRSYITRNKALAYEPEEYTLDMIKARMRQIMMGEVAMPSYDRKGNPVTTYPMHKDMVSAGKLLFEMMRYEDGKPKPTLGEFEVDDDLMDRSTSFIREFAGRRALASKESKESKESIMEQVVEVGEVGEVGEEEGDEP